MEGEEDTVRWGLHQPEPVGVAGVHAARGRAGLQDHPQQGQPRLHRHVPGLWAVGGLLPEHLPGGHRRGVHRPGAQARLHLRRPLARRRHAHLQHLALVDPHRQRPAMGLCARWSAGDEGHGQAHGILQGDVDMGQMGRLQRGHLQDQGLLPGHLPNPLQWSRVGGEIQQLRAADAADRGSGLRRRAAPGAGRREERARRHVQAGVPPRHHAAVAAAEGRAPVRIQRRPPGQRLQPLVPRRPARHLEPDFVRVSHCIGKRKWGTCVCEFILCQTTFCLQLFHIVTFGCCTVAIHQLGFKTMVINQIENRFGYYSHHFDLQAGGRITSREGK